MTFGGLASRNHRSRPTVLFAAALSLAACGSSTPLQSPGDGGTGGAGGGGTGGASDGGPGGTGDGGPADSGNTVTQVFQAAANRDLDVLFMIDNSPSMRPLQTKLAANFPVFISTLSKLGGTPNLHLGVVSSSLGSGPKAPTTQCPVGGDRGEFQTAPRLAGCTTGLPADQHFLSSVNGVSNFTGDIAQAFSCIAQLGDQGCGFEHQFASVLRALEPGADQPAVNQGFLRPSAYLAIVLVTNEDDCSAPPDSDLFDTTSLLVSDPLGPLASFRCNEFGHLCGGQKPPRTPAVLTDCTSAEDGRLLKVADVIARTKALKADPSKILVAAIAAPATPYEVILTPGTTATGVMEDQPNIKHSCAQPDGTYGDPAIRIKAWVDAFKGSFVSICDKTFEPALGQIANTVAATIQAAAYHCLDGKLLDTDSTMPGLQSSCTVTDILADDKGATTETPVPSCAAAAPGTVPCWSLSTNNANCPSEAGKIWNLIALQRGAMIPSPGLSTRVTCAVCQPGDTRAGCHY